MKYPCIYADLPRGGLGNKLLVWARAVSFSRLNDMPLYVSNWSELKIGPYLRKEKCKRQYWGYFSRHNRPSALMRLVFSLSKRETDPPLVTASSRQEKLLYVFRTMHPWPDYFGELHAFRSVIVDSFRKNISQKYLSLARSQPSPVIGVHVRRSDFIETEMTVDPGNACNQRMPIAYFVQAIRKIREIQRAELPVTVFTDGREDEVKELLALPRVSIARRNPDIVDMLLLARSQFIVVSPGSTFSYWAGFVSDSPIITHASSAMKIRPDGDGLFEGPVEAFDTFTVSDSVRTV